MYLVQALNFDSQTPFQKMFVHVHTYIGVQLREGTSLFSRMDPLEGYMGNLKQSCVNYFNVIYLFFSSGVTPMVWTIRYAIPYHAVILFQKFAFGMGINTVQGRDAKHSVIAKFAAHSTPALRWKLIFHHEFISSLWLRKKNSRSVHFNYNRINYLLEFIQNDTHCYCGLGKQPEEEKCDICRDSMIVMVKRSVRDSVLHESLANLLSTTSEIWNHVTMQFWV